MAHFTVAFDDLKDEDEVKGGSQGEHTIMRKPCLDNQMLSGMQ